MLSYLPVSISEDSNEFGKTKGAVCPGMGPPQVKMVIRLPFERYVQNSLTAWGDCCPGLSKLVYSIGKLVSLLSVVGRVSCSLQHLSELRFVSSTLDATGGSRSLKVP